MNIYKQISANRQKTIIFFFVFIFLFSGFFYLIGLNTNSANLYLVIGLLISSLTSGLSYFFSDKLVLQIHSARPANPKIHFDFFTVTENLAIASGLPMPKLYVINDPSLNAFATGRNPNHAVICVTTGLLDKLSRTELEGVVAHELAHIKNYDILLASVVSTLVGSIALVTELVSRSLWLKENRNKNKNPYLYLGLIIALIIMPLIATLIQLAISRKREFLADAQAALLTRYPEGLARALEKISQDTNAAFYANTATAHIFINNPLRPKKTTSWLVNLFNTHPPIEERIRILRSM